MSSSPFCRDESREQTSLERGMNLMHGAAYGNSMHTCKLCRLQQWQHVHAHKRDGLSSTEANLSLIKVFKITLYLHCVDSG